MFGSTALDVMLGLVFVYLMVALVCTAIGELIASARAMRARELWRGVRNLLEGTTWANLPASEKELPVTKDSTPWERFYAHPLIQTLFQPGRPPSYIPAQLFSSVVIDLVQPRASEQESAPRIRGDSTFDQIRDVVNAIDSRHLKGVLLPLIEEARSGAPVVRALAADGGGSAANPASVVYWSDLKLFKDQVESWFDNGMERVGGWYKRRAQFIVGLTAVVVVAVLNVDTIAITRALATNETLRSSVVKMAEAYAAEHAAPAGPSAAERPVADGTTRPTGDPATRPTTVPAAADRLAQGVRDVERAVGDVYQIGVPMGWTRREWGDLSDNPLSLLSKLLGLAATALAASLGAPFWFDLLNKVVAIRAAGKAPEERPRPPKEVPKPREPKDTP